MTPTPVRSVIVLGGGTAGLLSAISLRLKVPDLPVRLIRSKDIGVIGVGEGTTVAVTPYLHGFLNLDPGEFYREVRPIWKLGINFIWGPRPSFNFTFASHMCPPNQMTGLPRPLGYYCDDDMDCASLESALIGCNRAFRREPASGLPLVSRHHAYHLENRVLVDYLERMAAMLGTQIIDDTVTAVECSERGVERLKLASGTEASADLLVDSSGFSSQLLGKALGEPFVSYKSSLFCDRAVVGGWQRGMGELIQPYTVAETMDAGWCWRIDHEHLINRGYVYSSDFVSDEQADEEFRRKNPKVQNTRIVKFRSGRYRRSWVKNVVAIGNAGGFVEPLESTAIAAICEQTRVLTRALNSPGHVIGPKQVEVCALRDARYWDAIRRFLAVHYKFNTRVDTPFWREARENTDLAGAEPLVEYYQECGPDDAWALTLVDPHDQFGLEGYLTMLVGQRVPYHVRYRPTSTESLALEALRQRNRREASAGYRAEEALRVVRMAGWQWRREFYQ
jgi:tryptophan halogenase